SSNNEIFISAYFSSLKSYSDEIFYRMNPTLIGDIFEMLEKIYYRLNDNQNAISCFKEAVKFIKDFLPKENDKIATRLFQLRKFCLRAKQYLQAKECFEELLMLEEGSNCSSFPTIEYILCVKIYTYLEDFKNKELNSEKLFISFLFFHQKDSD